MRVISLKIRMDPELSLNLREPCAYETGARITWRPAGESGCAPYFLLDGIFTIEYDSVTLV